MHPRGAGEKAVLIILLKVSPCQPPVSVNGRREGDWAGHPESTNAKLIARFTGRTLDLSAVPGRGRVSLLICRWDQILGERGAGEYIST